MISKIKIERYKAHKSTTINNLKNINFFTGDNFAKTSFLEALKICLHHSAMEDAFRGDTEESSRVKEIFTQGSKKLRSNIDIEIGIREKIKTIIEYGSLETWSGSLDIEDFAEKNLDKLDIIRLSEVGKYPYRYDCSFQYDFENFIPGEEYKEKMVIVPSTKRKKNPGILHPYCTLMKKDYFYISLKDINDLLVSGYNGLSGEIERMKELYRILKRVNNNYEGLYDEGRFSKYYAYPPTIYVYFSNLINPIHILDCKQDFINFFALASNIIALEYTPDISYILIDDLDRLFISKLYRDAAIDLIREHSSLKQYFITHTDDIITTKMKGEKYVCRD